MRAVIRQSLDVENADFALVNLDQLFRFKFVKYP